MWQTVKTGLGYFLLLGGVLGFLRLFGGMAISEADYQLNRIGVNAFEGGRVAKAPNFTIKMANVGEEIENGREEGMNEIGDFRLRIPEVFVDTSVVEGVNAAEKGEYESVLQQGVAQARGSNEPGEDGLAFYFAHSSSLNTLTNPAAAVFYRLGRVERGDEVLVERNGEEFRYLVTEKEVIDANDVSFLQRKQEGVELIVLQTCWPIGTNASRLNVYAERV